MKFQLTSAVYDDLREIMEYYDETADSEVASRFYDEFRLTLTLLPRRRNHTAFIWPIRTI